MTWYPGQLRTLAVQILSAAGTLAETRVEATRSTKFDDNDLPAIAVYASKERKQLLSTAGTDPQFEANALLSIEFRTRGATQDDADAQADTLIGQIHSALLCSVRFRQQAGRVFAADVTCEPDMHTDGYFVGGAVHLQIRYRDTYPIEDLPALKTVDLAIDLGRPFDAAGQFDPAYPAPRTSGPDGRVELHTRIALPQPPQP